MKRRINVIHQMSLYGQYFRAIKEGKKKIEVRLNDEKRKEIKVDDIIKFNKIPEQNDTLQVQVIELKTYDTFKEMYEDIPFKEFDCERMIYILQTKKENGEL